MTALMRPVNLLLAHRQMLAATCWNDLRARFAGSVLGLAWLILYPCLLLGTYAVVYLFIFKVRFPGLGSAEYVMLIFCGLIPFMGFSEALATGVSSVTSNASLIKNTLFPIDLIPVKAVLTSQATQLVGLAGLLLVLALSGKLTVFALLCIPIWCAQILFTVGLIWVLSSLNVFARDLQSVVAVLTMVLMMVSPIAYTEEMIPDALQPFLRLNPLYYLIVAYQNVLMRGQLPPAHVLATLGVLALSSFFLGSLFFARMKRVFVDNV